MIMGLNETRISNKMSDKYGNFCTDKSFDNNLYNKRMFIDIWQEELDKEFQMADQSNNNFVITPPAGTLFFDFADTGFGEQMCRNISNGVCEYWSKAIGLGSPAHLDVIITVTNDALEHIEPLYNDIINIRTNSLESNYFLRIHEIIMKHVKEIIWTVTEMKTSDGSTQDFLENVF